MMRKKENVSHCLSVPRGRSLLVAKGLSRQGFFFFPLATWKLHEFSLWLLFPSPFKNVWHQWVCLFCYCAVMHHPHNLELLYKIVLNWGRRWFLPVFGKWCKSLSMPTKKKCTSFHLHREKHSFITFPLKILENPSPLYFFKYSSLQPNGGGGWLWNSVIWKHRKEALSPGSQGGDKASFGKPHYSFYNTHNVISLRHLG